MIILRRHLHRTSKAEDEDDPIITIPYSILREVINDHEEQQSFLDVSRDIKKRQRNEDEENADDDSNVKDLIDDILRLKKRRVAVPSS